MSYQVIRQPDGQLAIFSTYTDTIVMWDADPKDVTKWFVDLAVADATRGAERIIEHVSAGNPREVYHQFAMTWDQALDRDRAHDGEAHKGRSAL